MSYSLLNKLKTSPSKTKVFTSLLTNNTPPRLRLDMKPSKLAEKEAKRKSWEDFDVSFGSFDEPLHEKLNYQEVDNKNFTTPSKSKPYNTNPISKRIPSFSSSVSFHDANSSPHFNDSWSKFDDGDSLDILESHNQFVKHIPKSPIIPDTALIDMDFEIFSQNSQNSDEHLVDDIVHLNDTKDVATHTASKRMMSPTKMKVVISPPQKRTRSIQQNRMYSTKPNNNDILHNDNDNENENDNDNDKPDAVKHHTILLQTQIPAPITSDTVAKKSGFKPAKIVKPMVLSSEQEYILQLVREGVSLFYTGSAGTGKSVLLRAIIKSLKSQYKKGEVAVTASTGLAACNIGGITLHSFAGVGLGNGTSESLIKKVKRNRKAANRWREVKVLIIDEISMIDGKFFNMLDLIARKLRRSNQPFGGIQVVVCGDFYQLPPVSKATDVVGSEVKERIEAMFAFESQSWMEAIEKTLVLKEVFRQKGDQKFIDMLNEMRSGYVSDDNNAEFKKLSRPLDNTGGIEPAQLYCTRYEVERANNHRLNLLKGNTFVFKAKDSGTLPMEQRQNVLSNFLTPENLFLKVGAQVMCIKNFDETLVNGSLGQVVAFVDRDTYMHYKLMEDNPDDSAEDIQLKANAIKARERKERKEEDEIVPVVQGSSAKLHLDDSVFDFMEDIESDEEDLSELGIVFKQNITRKKELIKTLHDSSSKSKYPLVRFLLPDKNHRTLLVEPEVWTTEDEQGNVLAKRVQIPLILAWSLSIHKSQGQTLQQVKVDLRNVFENGQAYVALSRAVSREGIQVLNFDRSKVKTHAKVRHFYSSLISASESKKKAVGQQKLSFIKNHDLGTPIL